MIMTEYDVFIQKVVSKIPYYQDFAINSDNEYIAGTARKIINYAMKLAHSYKLNRDNYMDDKARRQVYRYEDLYRKNVARFEDALLGGIFNE